MSLEKDAKRRTDRTIETDASKAAGRSRRAVEGEEHVETIELRGEELVASKRRVQAGEVEIRKEVVTEVRTIEVPITREVIVIERHGVGQAAGGQLAEKLEAINLADLKPGESIRIPIVEEEVTVEKRPVVKEELSIRKDIVEEKRRVSDSVRREEVRLEHAGDIHVIGSESAIEHPEPPAR